MNWGDLSCVGAWKKEDQDGSISYEVLIEEAAPEAYDLRCYVSDYLFDKGFVDVEVLTEW